MLRKGRSIPENQKIKLIIRKCRGKGRDAFHTKKKERKEDMYTKVERYKRRADFPGEF